MTTYLGKSCSFCLPRVPFVNCCQFVYLVISLLVLRAGCGIWLYQFLIIAYHFTLRPQVMYYWPFQRDVSVVVYSKCICPLPVTCSLDYLFIMFRITWWTSAGKELTSWLTARDVFSLCRLDCLCSFPVWCLEKDEELNCIGSWSLPFHLLLALLWFNTAFACIVRICHFCWFVWNYISFVGNFMGKGFSHGFLHALRLCHIMKFLFLTHRVSWMCYGIRLYQFLIFAFSSSWAA